MFFLIKVELIHVCEEKEGRTEEVYSIYKDLYFGDTAKATSKTERRRNTVGMRESEGGREEAFGCAHGFHHSYLSFQCICVCVSQTQIYFKYSFYIRLPW